MDKLMNTKLIKLPEGFVLEATIVFMDDVGNITLGQAETFTGETAESVYEQASVFFNL